jgi:molybdopterin-guanine dinucleotide biosynthesis protein A
LNATQPFSLGILAGGQGTRWGGRDKGLIAKNGQSLIAGITHPRPTAAQEVLVCCRTYPHFYQHFSDRVLCEVVAGLGPCAGIVALLSAVTTPTLMVLPVDLIGSPQEIIKTLEHEWREDDTALFLTDAEGNHSPCIRLHADTLTACSTFLDAGGRKITGLLETIEARAVQVDSLWLRDADLPESMAT